MKEFTRIHDIIEHYCDEDFFDLPTKRTIKVAIASEDGKTEITLNLSVDEAKKLAKDIIDQIGE